MNINREAVVVGSAVTVAFGLGGGLAYILTKRKYEGLIDFEVETFKQEYAALQEVRVEQLAESRTNEEVKAIIQTQRYKPAEEEPGEEKIDPEMIKDAIESHRLFDTANNEPPEWDQEAEEDSRRNGVPYILSKAEFYGGTEGFSQQHLTYFEPDGALVDEEDVPVPDLDALVGAENMMKFGYGSGDPKVIYIRNENMQLDMEITLNENSYNEVVLGADIRHSSDSRKTPRFRLDE